MKLTRSVEKLYERLRWGGYYRPAGPGVGRDVHLQEAARWLCRAQDAGSDRGFSYGVRFGRDYEPSYPETTGYIIPTMLSLEKHYGDPGYRTRAVEAADWEVAIQMDSGAVMGGKVLEVAISGGVQHGAGPHRLGRYRRGDRVRPLPRRRPAGVHVDARDSGTRRAVAARKLEVRRSGDHRLQRQGGMGDVPRWEVVGLG